MLERFIRGIVEREGKHSVVEVPVDQISVNPYQARRNFDQKKLEELAQSIREQGVIQPIILRRFGSGYELVAGERRLRASKMAGLKTIPAIIRQLDEQDMIEIAFIENLQREQLNAIEEAEAYGRLVGEHGAGSAEEIAERVGKDAGAVASQLWLLSLPQVVKKAVVSRLISLDHARIIAGVRNEKKQVEFLERIYREKLSVEDAKKLLEEVPAIFRDEIEAGEERGGAHFSREAIRQLDVCVAMLRDLILAFRQAGINVSVTEYFDALSLNVRLTFPIEKFTLQ
ncbi:MAG: ParB/RepB/Spo0J family partition protein [bacterium]